LNDQSIIDLYFARDEEAIRETERAHGAFCMGVSMSILNNRQDAEECVNDTYLRAWNAIPPTVPRCLRAFLARIVRNLSIDRYREKRAARPAAELEAAMAELASCIPTEGEREEAAALADLLDQFLRAEEEVDRRLFLGRYWHGAAVKDLAAGSGLSPNAVTKRLGKTRERFRIYLSERGYSV
jgi:RNA polymerase sigma-70 factor (ECF subfamily)